MSVGIMRNWHLSKMSKSQTLIEYYIKLQEYMYYEYTVARFNFKDRFKGLFDK